MFINNKTVVIFLLSLLSSSSYAQCIPVAGLQFEKISGQEIIASKNGKNFAVLTISEYAPESMRGGSLPQKISLFRFFSEELCIKGTESRFHIDGKLFYLYGMTLFKQ